MKRKPTLGEVAALIVLLTMVCVGIALADGDLVTQEINNGQIVPQYATVGNIATATSALHTVISAEIDSDITALKAAENQWTGGTNDFTNTVVEVGTPTADPHATPKSYADGNIGGTSAAFVSPAQGDAIYHDGTGWTNGPNALSPLWINVIVLDGTAGQGTWGITISSLNMFGTTRDNSATEADGDNITFTFCCPEGTYTLKTHALTAANQGIVDVYIDGAEVGSNDRYSAGTVRRAPFDITNIVLGAGSHTIKYQEDGKNASASAFRFTSQGTWLIRE